jgi:hypothetical protein
MNEIEELICRRRKQILVHSYLYYEMNNNVISDHTYDEWCKELADLQKHHPIESNNVPFYRDSFEGYDGSTGFHLPKEAWMHDIGFRMLMYQIKIKG